MVPIQQNSTAFRHMSILEVTFTAEGYDEA